VYATVRRATDGEALQRAPEGALTPLIMDVTEPDHIAAAAAAVSAHAGRRGVDVLVNNAGVGIFYPLELIPLPRFRWQFEVNVDGQLAVTQAFLPALRLAAGRIVMIGSIADRITMPFAGPLAAAKHAVLALTEALRLELAPWNIHVVLVEPASIRTDAIEKFQRDAESAIREFDVQSSSLYSHAFRSMTSKGLAQEQHGSSPDAVAAVVLRAVSSNRPKTRYLAGKHSRLLATLAQLPPATLDRLRRRLFGLPRPGSMAVSAATSASASAPPCAGGRAHTTDQAFLPTGVGTGRDTAGGDAVRDATPPRRHTPSRYPVPMRETSAKKGIKP
jgi:NAD(P)-dependent dehydrogenase (short-subunit alcohol dehydrogenase family)